MLDSIMDYPNVNSLKMLLFPCLSSWLTSPSSGSYSILLKNLPPVKNWLRKGEQERAIEGMNLIKVH
jgi:hypothetical protein